MTRFLAVFQESSNAKRNGRAAEIKLNVADAVGAVLAVSAILDLSGCAGAALNRDYGEYSKAYSISTNQQLLRNLARLRNDDPPYFLQLGQISSLSSYQGSLGFSPGNTTTTHPSGVSGPWNSSQWALGGMVGVTAAQTPTFQFLPLSGDSLTQAISVPVGENIFYGFIKQGWPVDLVARTLVEYVDVPDVFQSNNAKRRLFNDPRDKSTYHDFLIWCYNYRWLQDHHKLTIVPSSDTTYGGASTVVFSDAKLSDVVAAKQAGYSVTNTLDALKHNTFTLNTAQPHPSLGPMDSPHRMLFSWEHLKKGENESSVNANIQAMTSLLASRSLSVDTEFNQPPQGSLDNTKPLQSIHSGALGLRSFMETMSALSKEELIFSHLNPNDRIFTLPNGSSIPVAPILSITRPEHIDPAEHYNELVTDDYRDKQYVIGDLESENFYDGADPDVFEAANKKVFILLTYLFADVSIDPKKLPVQQVLAPAP